MFLIFWFWVVLRSICSDYLLILFSNIIVIKISDLGVKYLEFYCCGVLVLLFMVSKVEDNVYLVVFY